MYSLLRKLSPLLLLLTIVLVNESSANPFCSLNDMRRYAKTVCEGVVRHRRSLHYHSVFNLDNYHVTLVKDHPQRDTLFPELHPKAKIVTADPPFPENGFLIVMDTHHMPHSSATTTTNGHHLQRFNEVHKRTQHHHLSSSTSIDEERPRIKRQPNTPINNINYCCAMPKDIKLCKTLLCGHYD